MRKINILFIQPLFYNPTLPNFKDRFELLSDKCCGHIISISDKKYDGLKFGEFTYHALPYISNKVIRYPYYIIKNISIAIRAHKAQKFDYIHSYDPIFFGFSATLINLFIRAKVIIEVNSHLKTAPFMLKTGISIKMKKIIFMFLVKISFRNAHIIKILNRKHLEEWQALIGNKHIIMFEDFVPTHIFNSLKSHDEKYVLFLGHPFYLKGVDILIKAFLNIADKFPEYRLKIVGHCHGGEKEREEYIKMANGNRKIEIHKPVFYNEAVNLVQKCTFLVLPSRSDAMPRVLIEAMSCGKAMIGSRVGGIPDLIKHGVNGFLFESENVNDLADKMQSLLESVELREKMGKRSLELVNERYSSLKYVEKFVKMVEDLDE